MLNKLGKQELTERDAIIAEITAAFKDVTRGKGAISWRQCVVLDNYGAETECLKQVPDDDLHWMELIDNKTWQPFPGIGGFAFINAEGFRYYLPPTIIRFLLNDITEWYSGHLLSSIDRFIDPQRSLVFTDPQIRSVARFIKFMADNTVVESYDPMAVNCWVEAIELRWGAKLPE